MKKQTKVSARRPKKTKAGPSLIKKMFKSADRIVRGDLAQIEARIVAARNEGQTAVLAEGFASHAGSADPRTTLERYLRTAKVPRVRQQLKALMLGMPDLDLNDFMRRRPPAKQAFLCANDAAYLLHVYMHGHPPVHVSPTNDRSRLILLERGLISCDATDYRVTRTGQDLVNQILSIGYGGVPKPYTSVTEEAGRIVNRACWTGGRVGKNLNPQSIPRRKT